MKTVFTRVQPDLPAEFDPKLGSRLQLARVITNPLHYDRYLKDREPPLQEQGLDEALLQGTSEAIRKLIEEGDSPLLLRNNGLVLVSHPLEGLQGNEHLVPALIEATQSFGEDKRAGLFVAGNFDDGHLYGFTPFKGGSLEFHHAFGAGNNLLLGGMEDDFRTRRSMTPEQLLLEENKNIRMGAWMMDCDTYTPEDAERTVHDFLQAKVAKRKALETFLKGL